MRRVIAMVAIVMVVCALSSGCTNMDPTAQGATSGALIGAGGGAALSAIAGGNPAIGALVGGIAGTATGAIIGESKKRKQQ